jgi:hypothetical protein
LILGVKAELRYKFSALQVGLTDLENNRDDTNQLTSAQEEIQFVPQEILLQKCDQLEQDFKSKLSRNRNINEIFDSHQTLLSLALFVWDYPSRQEKFTLEFLEESGLGILEWAGRGSDLSPSSGQFKPKES